MRKLLIFIICICFGLFVNVRTAEAANPRVMVSDYSVKEGAVIAGKEFTLILNLKNTASRAVKNVKLSIYTENGELLPAKGAGTTYISQIDIDGEEKLTFHMMAVDGLEEKAYKLSLKIEYESSNGMEYTVEEAVFIPVSLEQRLSVTDVFMAEEGVELGDTVEISAVANNLGDGMLYNVTARIEGDNLREAETYVGNIEPGKSGMVDILTKATVVTQGDHRKNRIIIFYEDKAGTVYEQENDVKIGVSEPLYHDLEKVKESKENSGVIKTVLLVLSILALSFFLAFLFIKKRRRKQEILEEMV